MVMLSRKFQFYLGIVNTFPAVFYIFLGIFSAFMHKISHSASPREKFYAFWQRKCQEKCRKQLEKWWQFLGKISTCLTLLPHVGNLYFFKKMLAFSFFEANILFHKLHIFPPIFSLFLSSNTLAIQEIKIWICSTLELIGIYCVWYYIYCKVLFLLHSNGRILIFF